jgi:hypothetical protein
MSLNLSTNKDWIISTARNRNETYLLNKPYSHSNSNGVIYTGDSVANIYVAMSDNVTDNWKAKQKAGTIVMNDMSKVDDEIIDEVAPHEWEQTLNSDGALIGWNYGTRDSAWLEADVINMPNLVTESSIRNLVLDKVYARANESEALALVTLAEMKKTYNMFSNTMRGVVRMARASGRLRRKLLERKLTPNQFRKKWLEMRYGWRPLIYDTLSMIKAAQKAGNKRRLTFRVEELDRQDVPESLDYFVNQRHQVHYKTNSYDQIVATAGLLVEWDDPLKGYSDTYGLDRNLETAWELIPYSFVIDWFLNTANYMAARSTSQFEVKGSWVTTVRTQSVIREYTHWAHDSINPVTTTYANYNGSRHGRVLKTRNRYANPPLALLPTVQVKLNVSKLVDIIALLAGLKSQDNPGHLRV